MSARGRRHLRRAVWTATVVVALSLLGMIGPLSTPAAAHATLLSTTPTNDELLDRAPDEVQLRFDEAVEVFAGAVRVIGPNGNRADSGRVNELSDGSTIVVPIDAERRGTYTVAWRVLSEDSHDLTGSFVFHVGIRTGAADVAERPEFLTGLVGGVGRWLAFAGALLIVGLVTLRFVAGGERAVERRLRSGVVIAGVAGVAGVLAVLVAQAAEASGRGALDAIGLVPDLAADTRTGVLTSVRVGTMAVATALAAVRPVWRRAPWSSGLAALASLGMATLSGHAWTSSTRSIATVSDLVHLAAVSVWAGGIVGLALTLRLAADRGRLVRRFSRLALVCVVAVAVSGTISGLVHVGSLKALTTTEYGALLVMKVVGFVALVGLGWANRRRFMPVLERSATPLLRSVRGEVAIVCAVLAVTALLVNQPPARDSLSEPFNATVTAGEDTMQATIEPAQVGVNDIHLYFFHGPGTEPEAVDAVEVTAATGTIPPRRLTVTPITPSHVSAYGASLSSPGTWKIAVTAVRAGTPTTFNLEVPIR